MWSPNSYLKNFFLDKPDAPKLNSQPIITDNSIMLQMTHNKTCFKKHNFFLDFNVTVNSEKVYNSRTSSIEEPITIQNLEPGTEHNISVVAVCKQDGGVRSKIFATTIKTTSVASKSSLWKHVVSPSYFLPMTTSDLEILCHVETSLVMADIT